MAAAILALAAATASLPSRASLERRIAADRAAIEAAEAPLQALLGVAARAAAAPATAARREATMRAQALIQAWAPVIEGRTRPLRRDLDRLLAEHARGLAAGLLHRAGARPRSRPEPVLPCTSAAWRLPPGAYALTPGAAAALGRPDGLTMILPPDTGVPAPAAATVAYAGSFRRYGGTVILHHGHGWTSLLTGLGPVAVRSGAAVLGGETLAAADPAAPLLTVTLTRHGRPVDPLAMTRRCDGWAAGSPHLSLSGVAHRDRL